jgi:hypothetical protein
MGRCFLGVSCALLFKTVSSGNGSNIACSNFLSIVFGLGLKVLIYSVKFTQ